MDEGTNGWCPTLSAPDRQELIRRGVLRKERQKTAAERFERAEGRAGWRTKENEKRRKANTMIAFRPKWEDITNMSRIAERYAKCLGIHPGDVTTSEVIRYALARTNEVDRTVEVCRRTAARKRARTRRAEAEGGAGESEGA